METKIVAKSLTEAELVGVDNTLGYILWACYFMDKQGHDMDPSVLYQDYVSAILLETKGKASSTKQTKHIKVKYFYGMVHAWIGQKLVKCNTLTSLTAPSPWC